MTTIIYSAYDCLVKGEGWQENLDQNQHLSFDDLPQKIWVYPLSRGKIAFEIDLSKHDSAFYRIVKKEDKTLIFLIDGISAQNVKVFDINADGQKCKIEIESERVVFSSADNKKIISLGSQISGGTCGAFYHIAYAKVACKGGEYLLAYNTKTAVAKAFCGERITLTDEGFIVSITPQNYEDATQEYIVTKAGLKLKKQNFSSLGLPPEHSLSFQFMSAIKLGDLQSAHAMLAPSLKENLLEEQLKIYFGEISYIYPLNQTSVFAISGGKNIIYTFSIDGGLICDINDNQN